MIRRPSPRSGSAPTSFRFAPHATLALATLLLAGCGPENELGRLPYSGTVNLDGKPLDQGSISFEPTKPGEGTTRSGAQIVEGAFEVEALDGLPPGEYLVRIHSAGEVPEPPPDEPPGMMPPPAKERIPPAYNVQSKETITIEEGAENHFPFDITTRD